MAKKTGTAVAKAKGTAVANWKEELRKAAQEEKDRVPAGSGNSLQLSKKQQFRHQGADIGSEITCVIVGHVYNNVFYDRDFDEDNPTPPACFAQSLTGKNMAPLDASPAKQSEICEECWAHEWKSDKRGKGRACKNKHQLAVLLEDDLDEEDPELVFLTLPVTTGANFRKYVGKLNDNDMPSWGVMTVISFDDKSDWQKLQFELKEELPEEFRGKVMAKIKSASKTLMEPPSFDGYTAPKGAKAAKGKKTDKRSRLS